MKSPISFILAPLAFFLVLYDSANAQECPQSILSAPDKLSVLYLYFPTATDNTFPSQFITSYGTYITGPIAAFDMANHASGSLSTAAVRNRTLELVRVAYCEFEVDVRLAVSATTPTPAAARWQIVGFGSDNNPSLVGVAQAVDTGDSDSQDYARFWGESLESFIGTEGTGANETVERWATAIANLAAHESGHNYGGMHSESQPNPGTTEDAAPNHFMADPAEGATAASIAVGLNHFSDRTYERLGHDIGLTTSTLHNWDFVNPNATNADSLIVTVLSTAAALTVNWSYAGSLSPWTGPTVVKRPGIQSFQGTAYNIFDVTFSTPKSWANGANGIAPPGVRFHVGATFAEPDAIIVYETTLRNGGTNLDLRPRMFGYDAGTTSPDFAITFFNPQADDAGPLILEDVNVLFLPRMIDIEQMVQGGRLVGMNGFPVTPYRGRFAPRLRLSDEPVRIGREPLVLPIARLTDARHVDQTFRETDCRRRPTRRQPRRRQPSGGPGFGIPSVDYCPTAGTSLSLFPATYTYVTATVVDPNGRIFDPAERRIVNRPVRTRLFFQAAGFVPDANENGLDDLLDIRRRTSRDRNSNGIPDEAESAGPDRRTMRSNPN